MIINLFAGIVGFLIVTGFITATGGKTGSLENNFTIISYVLMYCVQLITIALVLFCEKGLNKKFAVCMSYISLPLLFCGIGLGILLYNHVELISAISLLGPEVVFAGWIADLLKNLEV